MRTWRKVLAFGVGLVIVLGVAIGIGRLVGPIDTESDDGHDAAHDTERVHLEPVDEHGMAATYDLALERDVVDGGRAQVAFRILDEAGEPVTSYDVQHEKRLHLIAVRRDLAEFRHVHPRLDAATGRWSVPIALGAGDWRLYADFAPVDADPTVAEADLMVAGQFAPEELGQDTAVSTVDGYEVHLERDAATSMVTLDVTRGGTEVTDLEPYLGAYGHLVAIRADDLAYLHVHPEEGEAGPEVGFYADLAEAGRYRLFLDFKHDGRVHTADFTITVDESAGHDEEGSGGHDH